LRDAVEHRQWRFDAGHGPAGAGAMAMPAQAFQRTRLSKQRLMSAIEACTMAEVGDIAEWSLRARCREPFGRVLCKATHLVCRAGAPACGARHRR
jgi:hypothetical protein